MDKDFLNQYIKLKAELINKASIFGLDVDFKDSQYLLDLLQAYSLWPKSVLWKEVLSKVLEFSNETIDNEKSLNKVKQWTNRYFERAIKDGLVIKKNTIEDKRVVMFEWSEKGLKLMKIFTEK